MHGGMSGYIQVLLGHGDSTWHLRPSVQHRGSRDLPRAIRLLGFPRGLPPHATHGQNRTPRSELHGRPRAEVRARHVEPCAAARRRRGLAWPSPTRAPMIRAFIVLCALAFSLSPRAAAASEADPWFGPDKAMHFSVS